MNFDLLVIGSGPAGQKAAVQGAKAKKRVALIEGSDSLGGACLHWGTLPSKSFRESVYRYSLSSRASKIPSMERLLRRKQRVVENEERVILNQLHRNNITVYNGFAKFTGPHEVVVTNPNKPDEKPVHLFATVIVIAVGAHPVSPKGFESDGEVIFDSDSILDLPEIPERMLVMGGGIIGCEYASMFSTAGTHVTLVDRRKQILSSVDVEISKNLVNLFRAQGMEIWVEDEIKTVEVNKKNRTANVTLISDKKLKVNAVLMALGRRGNTDQLGLENIGITADDRGLLKVNAHFQTTQPHIYAVGDVIGPPALASTSMEQGRLAICHAFQVESGGHTTLPPFYPYGIYTIPEVSMVGLTEEECIAKKIPYIVGKAFYGEIARGQIVGDEFGLLKLVASPIDHKILGVHIMGDSAADLIHIGQAVMTLNGTLRYFIDSVFNYPTLAEAYKTAAFHALNQRKSPA